MIVTPMATVSAITFWVAAPIAIAMALGVVMSRKPVHSAISLAGLMITLATLYAGLDATFLFVTQIIVYTGAVMMLFLFVMMILGVDTKDSMVEMVKGHRVLSAIVVVAFMVLLGFVVATGVLHSNPDGLDPVNKEYGTNVHGLAALIFGRYFYIFEVTAALLITGAIGAMVFAHGEQLRRRPTQRTQLADRMSAYAKTGAPIAPRPGAGVYARSNSIELPALLPDGSESEDSKSEILLARGAVVDTDQLVAPTTEAFGVIRETTNELMGGDAE